MKVLHPFRSFLVLLLASVLFIQCNDDDGENIQVAQNIVEIASGDERFSTLVEALDKAGLIATIQNNAALTVFAPTNDAFQKTFDALGVDNVDGLISAVGAEKVTQILLYHVLGAKVTASEVLTGFVSTAGTRTAGGSDNLSMYLDATDGVRINNKATVTSADIDATNGVIHVIDEVLLPLNIVELAALSTAHTTLVASLGAANGDLVTALSGDGPFTVFAPINQAFADIQSTVDGLDMDQLASVLLYHVVGDNVRSDAVPSGDVMTLADQNISLDTSSGVTITDAGGGNSDVVITDIQGTNGVIHVVNSVLIPTL